MKKKPLNTQNNVLQYDETKPQSFQKSDFQIFFISESRFLISETVFQKNMFITVHHLIL